MTRPLDRHLDGDELDALVTSQAPGVTVAGRLSEEAIREAQRHVKSCQDCDRKVQMHRSAQSVISMRAMSGEAAKGPKCSGQSEWVRVAAGLLEESEAKERMNHAAQCGHCGSLLKAAVKSLSDETTPDEEAVVANLASARPDWQARMAGTLRRAAEPRQQQEAAPSFWKSILHGPRPVFATAALAIVIAATWTGVRLLRSPSAEQLLAQAYTERRTIEVRIPGAKYAPLAVQRSAGGSSFDKPQSLLKAEVLISENLRKNPTNPQWLDARARAELLDRDYGDAIKTLQRAQESYPDSPELLRDLGAAFYLRAQAENRADDYGTAFEILSLALHKAPDDPIALFNRALTCEQNRCYKQAADDWEHYLRIDPNGDWSDEARRKLQEVKSRVEGHNQGTAIPLLTPAQIAIESTADIQAIGKLDERIEEYLSLATSEWLPEAYPARSARNAETDQTKAALQILARVMREKHGDTWLDDLLKNSSSQDFAQAIEDLAAAVQADEAGNNVLGSQQAREAERLFENVGNYAGYTRAHVESVFAAHDAQDAATCMNLANAQRLNPREPHRWLAIQFHLEEGTCYRLSGNLGEARRLYEQAANEAQRSKYPVIYLRTQDHLSTLDSQDGDLAEAWARSQTGLKLFWSGPYRPMRGYNFYFNLYEFAQVRRQPNLQIAVWREGVALSDTFSDYVIRAMAHSLMAEAAVAAGQTSLAKREFQLSSDFFAQAPQIKSTRIAHIEAEARLAQVEITEGNAPSAVDRLRQYAPEVEHLSDNLLGILFDTSLANAEAAAGNDQEAESALHAAVSLSELHLRSIHDERSRLEWAKRTASAYRYLVQLELLKGDSQGALELWEWYRGAALRAGVPSQDAAKVIRPEFSLPNRVAGTVPTLTKTTYVSYALLPRGIAVWVYDNRGVFSQWIEINSLVLSTKADRFRSICADSRSEISDVQSNARALYQTLVAPIEAHLAEDRILVIDADDGISGLPFEALIDSENRYFGDRYTAVSSLGLYYQPDARRTDPISADSVALAIAVPTSHATDVPVPALPDAVSEAETVAREFHNAHLLSESGAAVGAVLAELPAATVFHFAGHALSSVGKSGLLLSDGLLKASSLQKTKLPHMQLVVLSACDTQGGTTGEAQSGDSLVRAFLRAGAARVVASRWNVDSVGTHEFMELFYRALLAGNTVAGSLHHAQSALRSQPGLGHPYYWSAFTAFGAS